MRASSSDCPMADFRSDTVTRPTPAMLRAMQEARVGDDVWGDDPAVLDLQERTARAAGKAAALFFPSGTQSNLAALMAHCGRGDEYIVGQDAHTYKFEGGGAAVLGSIQPQPIENEADGSLPLSKIKAAIKPNDPHFARTRVIALENTINGVVLPKSYVDETAMLARDANLIFHLDGARAWNAAVAMDCPIAEVARPFRSASLCFSKGMGAPVGSVLVADEETIEKARRWRKVLGGGMRQSGYLAAACTYALDHHFKRLADDHDKAAQLALSLASVSEVRIRMQSTNMVFLDIPGSECAGLQSHLHRAGILASIGPRTRLVTHLDIKPESVAAMVDDIKRYFQRRPARGKPSQAGSEQRALY